MEGIYVHKNALIYNGLYMTSYATRVATYFPENDFRSRLNVKSKIIFFLFFLKLNLLQKIPCTMHKNDHFQKMRIFFTGNRSK